MLISAIVPLNAGMADELVDVEKLYTLTDIYKLRADKKYNEAIERLKPLVDAGNAEAEFVLGNMYENGLGVAADKTHAYLLYARSADGGYFFARREMALHYYREHRYEKALILLVPLANQGARGKVSMALSEMYEHGWGVESDQAKAECWMRKTIEPVAVSNKSTC